MNYIVTGADGQLGREMTKLLRKNSTARVEAFDKNTLDITDFNKVKNAVSLIRPYAIFNCAAYTRVDECEHNIEKAFEINALGAQNLAIAAENTNAKLIHISTDYVFSGEDKSPRREYDKTEPLNIYGKSKLYSEELVKRFCSRHFILRTAWLYGDGNNFVKTMIKLSKTNKKLTVVNDQTGSPTYTKDLAKVMLNLSDTEFYGIYHATNNKVCTWYEFAKKIFEIKNIDIEVEPVDSSMYKTEAKRPSYSVLDNFMLRLRNLDSFRNWEDALEEYLKGDEDDKDKKD